MKPTEMRVTTFPNGNSLKPHAMSDRTTSNPVGVLCLEPRQSGQFGDGEQYQMENDDGSH